MDVGCGETGQSPVALGGPGHWQGGERFSNNTGEAEAPRTSEESARYCNLSRWQEDNNVWDTMYSGRLGDGATRCDGGARGKAKETERGVLEVM